MGLVVPTTKTPFWKQLLNQVKTPGGVEPSAFIRGDQRNFGPESYQDLPDDLELYDPLALDFNEYGRSGLKRFSGRIYEEFLTQLSGDTALKVYQEMSTNSAVISAMLFAIDALMRQVDWFIEPPGEANEEMRATELVESCIHDMSQTWPDTLSEILSFLTYGFSYHEIVYKQRKGESGEPGKGSRFDDGAIGWRKFAPRSQLARWRWVFDEEGGIQGQWQLPPPDYRTRFVPIQKALLFRTQVRNNNPEGRSILRGAYRAWFFAKRIEEIEGIGIERDLAGLPVMYVPAEITHTSATADQKTLYSAIKKLVAEVRRDEREGLVLPQAYDPETKEPLFKFELLSTGSRRNFDTTAVLDRYNKQIAMTAMADFLFLGQQAVGSFALSSDKTALFSTALGSWLDVICGIVNRHAIPRLLGLNGYKLDKLPELKHGDIETMDLQQLAQIISAVTGAGMPLFPDMKAENWVRRQIGMPEMDEAERDEMLAEQEAQKQAALDMQREAAVQTEKETAAQGNNAKAAALGGQEKPAVVKYDPGQPRVPAGDAEGGQWEAEGAALGAGEAKKLVAGLESLGDDNVSHGMSEASLDEYRGLLRSTGKLGGDTPESFIGRGKTQLVQIKDLTATQGPVQRKALIEKLTKPSKQLPFAVRHKGKMFLVEGHHRTTAAKLKGLQQLHVEVFDLPD